jgi:hypothetical protein
MLQFGPPNAGACAVVIGPPRDLERQGRQSECVGGGRVGSFPQEPPRCPHRRSFRRVLGAGAVVESTLTRHKSALLWRVTSAIRPSGSAVKRPAFLADCKRS